MINAGFGTDIDRCVFWKGRGKKKEKKRCVGFEEVWDPQHYFFITKPWKVEADTTRNE